MLLSGGGERPRKPEDLIDSRLMARLDRIDLRTRRIFAGRIQGERRSKTRGQSVEFEDFREYVEGDDLRFIDWNVYARLDRLIIKIFLEEEDLALHLVIDASTSMEAGSPSKLVFSARLAMALAYVGLVNQNRVAVSVMGLPGRTGLVRLGDRRGRRHVHRLGQFLVDTLWSDEVVRARAATGAPAPGGDFTGALTTLARSRVGKGVMVVMSDLLAPEGYEAGLRNLAAAGGYDTWILQVLSPGEIDPAVDVEAGLTGDLRLLDAETGRATEVTITNALIKRYRERLKSWCDGINAYCLAREMTHLLVRSDAELERVIMDTLRRRGMVG
ncbi:MAG: DUF58 domain-containing protein [Phycisphaerales bacterium]|nr:DUF58 domain-containing protein [Phycisphaerales bacterium]